MAKKRKAEKPQREFTRRQLSQWQRQKRRQRIILGGGIFIIAAIVLIVLIGWYASEYRPMHQTVIKVNDAEFDTRYYIDTLKIAGSNQPDESPLSPAEYVQGIADSVVREIEQNELIRQGALALGISVSDDEVRSKLKGTNIPVNDATLDLVRSQLLRSKLLDEHFKSEVPASAEQAHFMAMLLESESQATEVRDRLQSSENFTALAEEFSLDGYSKNNKGDIGWHPRDIFTALLGSSVPGEYAFGSEVGVLSQPRYDGEIRKPVGYWLIKILARDSETDARVQAILVGSEEEARKVRARLEAGENFATLAEELSQYGRYRESTGEQSEVSKGDITAAFDRFVFDPKVAVGTLSEPIRDDAAVTKGGYWLVKVLGKEGDRSLESKDRDLLVVKAFDEWVSSLWVNSGTQVSNVLSERTKAWALEKVLKG